MKIKLAAFVFLLAVISVNAQIYTPNGVIQGSSTNNNVGIGGVPVFGKLELFNTAFGTQTFSFYTNDGASNSRALLQHITTSNSQRVNFTSSFSTGSGYANWTFANGNVGIGTTLPTASLEISTPAIAGAETLLKVGISDTSQDYFKITNGTNSTGQLIPTLNGYHTSDNRAALYLTASTESGTDNGTDPLMVFDSRTSTAPVVNRPLFAWDSYGNRKMTLTSNGNLGIGTGDATSFLSIGNNHGIKLSIGNSNWLKTAIIQTGYESLTEDFTDFKVASSPINNAYIRLIRSGNVGIGVTNPTNKLDVNGTIHSKEVKVDMLGWSDFVFKKGYNLPTLEEVEKHIIEKGHLENIPSEEEVLKNGINLGEMNSKLLQKIEELTLYMIEMKKENEIIKRENQEIKKDISNLKLNQNK